MQLIVNGDATFVSGWQAPYGGSCPLTGVTVKPGKPTKAFYEAQFPALRAKIKTPVAFAILAPWGWSGERCWYEYDVLPKFDWKPVAWKESTHADKTLVQLFMLKTGLPEPSERPTVSKVNARIAYSGTAMGCLPYLGCSSILSDYPEPKQEIKIPTPPMYAANWGGTAISAEGKKRFQKLGSVPSKECLHFIRCARPMSLSGLALLKQEGFRRIHQGEWFSYWVRGKEGLGTKDDCEY